jgi:AraC family transcriptional activator of pobA
MDFPGFRLHYRNMAARREIPTYKLYGEDFSTSADFWLHTETIPERTTLHNFEIAEHRHEAFFQIFLVTAGRGELLSGGGIERFSAPCAVFIPPGARHGFRHSRDIDGLVVTARADRLGAATASDRAIADFAAGTRMVAMDSGGEAQNAVATLERLAAERAQAVAGRAVMLEALMTMAIVSLARAAGAADSRTAFEPRETRAEALLSLIGTHFREHRPLAFYAARLGVSATHLNRIARNATGLSVQGLISRRIVEAAGRDLVFSPSPVQTIAYALGFSDPAYFNRFFRRATGMTPGAYRAAERKRAA